jgi:hypothetical protein
MKSRFDCLETKQACETAARAELARPLDGTAKSVLETAARAELARPLDGTAKSVP